MELFDGLFKDGLNVVATEIRKAGTLLGTEARGAVMAEVRRAEGDAGRAIFGGNATKVEPRSTGRAGDVKPDGGARAKEPSFFDRMAAWLKGGWGKGLGKAEDAWADARAAAQTYGGGVPDDPAAVDVPPVPPVATAPPAAAATAQSIAAAKAPAATDPTALTGFDRAELKNSATLAAITTQFSPKSDFNYAAPGAPLPALQAMVDAPGPDDRFNQQTYRDALQFVQQGMKP